MTGSRKHWLAGKSAKTRLPTLRTLRLVETDRVALHTNRPAEGLRGRGTVLLKKTGTRYKRAPAGDSESCTEVWLYTVNGGGHDWPGAWGNLDIEASREAWNFFAQLCETVSTDIPEVSTSKERSLTRVTDPLGRDTAPQPGKVLIYIYSDGSVEKRFNVIR